MRLSFYQAGLKGYDSFSSSLQCQKDKQIQETSWVACCLCNSAQTQITLTEHCQPIFSTGVQCHWTNCPHEASVQPLQKPEEATTLWRFASLVFKTNTGLPDVTRTKTAGLSSNGIACSPSASIGVAGSIACRASLLWLSSCSTACTISLSSCRYCHTVNNQGHVPHRAFRAIEDDFCIIFFEYLVVFFVLSLDIIRIFSWDYPFATSTWCYQSHRCQDCQRAFAVLSGEPQATVDPAVLPESEQ